MRQIACGHCCSISVKLNQTKCRQGDIGTATFKLGRAVQLAADSGNDGTMKLLQAVVEVEDPATGTVRLRQDVAVVDEMSLDTRSTTTVRVGAGTP